MTDDHVVADQSAVFAFLADPASHGGTAPVTRIDTHGAAVFLVGPDAYKVKRAVAFPFMDFSTLDKRREACTGEIAINRPNAPDLYLSALPVTEQDGRLTLGGAGTPVEWVVHMRRFDEGQTLDRVATREGLPREVLSALARAIADAHRRAPLCPPSFDAVAALADVASDNAASFRAAPELFAPPQVQALDTATAAALAACTELMRARADGGDVRRCHGDLHLRNIALIDGQPVLFDAIEFNPELATCDVLYDLAFLIMDLWQRGLRLEANGVLNRYLWAQDEARHYEALKALPLFLSLRAAIRAKVGMAALARLTGEARAKAEQEVRAYFTAALDFLAPSPPVLLAVGGLSGTGKSRLAARAAPRLGRAPGAVVLRSDVERKSLNGVAETERLPATGYSPEQTAQVYERVRQRIDLALKAGQAAVADAVHARPDERAAIRAVADRNAVRFVGLWLTAPLDLLQARVARRKNDASDATPEVVMKQADYDLGPMDWTVVDVSEGADAALHDIDRQLSSESDADRP
ncbi:putative kinase [Azorhizobium caulinodans ORS 571]|uniref:Putative kinase n=1 Tax=Azorhizobium caulinodans (strain ATCC 43989 / DSM 5975 / JCM 20966 / LMG 6465 / NBRC 14845 / NCIMB 13405 / ORS 571) TaxID=438753 RepID=A8HRC5_AZOC5|nr:bifunctional aminoglycoside phosphotransferase/ATP-binding protein [Azorhizobium caulinodans]BAF87163.1 putative kinase [Azorhizobium caulinodans ORS 571]